MKKRIVKLLLLSFTSILLSSCGFESNLTSEKESLSSSLEDFSSSVLSENISSENFFSENVPSEDNSSNENSNNSSELDEPKIIEIYASNDVHGRISENASENEPGISKLTTYLKERKAENEEGFIYINSGDYWQDTYESGYNKGKLLTECLDFMECETMSLGNHEFDWGIDVIRENKELTNTTFLGANIYQYPDTSKKVDFAEDYKIIERNGLKIGIIGAIGQNQLTSITSSNWENITFLPHTPIVKKLSDELRTEKDCDIVILSIHADEEDSDGNELTKISPISNKKYVDAVFCAHSHQGELKYYNGVPFVQGKSHGTQFSYVKLQYENDEVSVISASYDKGYLSMNSEKEDENINSLIDEYFTEEYLNEKNKTHGTIKDNSYVSRQVVGNILAKATYEILEEKDIDVDIVINNGGRDSVSAGEMTSEKIFNMMPFTNKTIVVQNIKGQDIINECVEYSNPYYVPDTSLTLNSSSYYIVAVIDYMLLHKNVYRNYNYFPSFRKENEIYTIEDYPNVIIEKHLQKHNVVSVNDYNTNNFYCL